MFGDPAPSQSGPSLKFKFRTSSTRDRETRRRGRAEEKSHVMYQVYTDDDRNATSSLVSYPHIKVSHRAARHLGDRSPRRLAVHAASASFPGESAGFRLASIRFQRIPDDGQSGVS